MLIFRCYSKMYSLVNPSFSIGFRFSIAPLGLLYSLLPQQEISGLRSLISHWAGLWSILVSWFLLPINTRNTCYLYIWTEKNYKKFLKQSEFHPCDSVYGVIWDQGFASDHFTKFLKFLCLQGVGLIREGEVLQIVWVEACEWSSLKCS